MIKKINILYERLVYSYMIGMLLCVTMINHTAEAVVSGNGEEMVTYRNAEYGFEFQYPKMLSLPDGTKKETSIETIDLSKGTTKKSVVLRLRSYSMGFSLYVEKKPTDFIDIHSYIEHVYKETDRRAKERGDYPNTNRIIQTIHIDNQEAFLVEYDTFRGIPESTLYIEKDIYLYKMFYQGHITAIPEEITERLKLSAIQDILNTFTFSLKKE